MHSVEGRKVPQARCRSRVGGFSSTHDKHGNFAEQHSTPCMSTNVRDAIGQRRLDGLCWWKPGQGSYVGSRWEPELVWRIPHALCRQFQYGVCQSVSPSFVFLVVVSPFCWPLLRHDGKGSWSVVETVSKDGGRSNIQSNIERLERRSRKRNPIWVALRPASCVRADMY